MNPADPQINQLESQQRRRRPHSGVRRRPLLEQQILSRHNCSQLQTRLAPAILLVRPCQLISWIQLWQ